MNPLRPIRTQLDDLQDEYSERARIDFTGTDSLVRPEFADDADINKLLRRYGIDQQLRPVTYGKEYDDTIDLQMAFAAIKAAEGIEIPEELRTKYNHWSKVLEGAESGEYQYDLQQLKEQKERNAAAAAAQAAAAVPPGVPTPTPPEPTPKV